MKYLFSNSIIFTYVEFENIIYFCICCLKWKHNVYRDLHPYKSISQLDSSTRKGWSLLMYQDTFFGSLVLCWILNFIFHLCDHNLRFQIVTLLITNITDTIILFMLNCY